MFKNLPFRLCILFATLFSKSGKLIANILRVRVRVFNSNREFFLFRDKYLHIGQLRRPFGKVNFYTLAIRLYFLKISVAKSVPPRKIAWAAKGLIQNNAKISSAEFFRNPSSAKISSLKRQSFHGSFFERTISLEKIVRK